MEAVWKRYGNYRNDIEAVCKRSRNYKSGAKTVKKRYGNDMEIIETI